MEKYDVPELELKISLYGNTQYEVLFDPSSYEMANLEEILASSVSCPHEFNTGLQGFNSKFHNYASKLSKIKKRLVATDHSLGAVVEDNSEVFDAFRQLLVSMKNIMPRYSCSKVFNWDNRFSQKFIRYIGDELSFCDLLTDSIIDVIQSIGYAVDGTKKVSLLERYNIKSLDYSSLSSLCIDIIKDRADIRLNRSLKHSLVDSRIQSLRNSVDEHYEHFQKILSENAPDSYVKSISADIVKFYLPSMAKQALLELDSINSSATRLYRFASQGNNKASFAGFIYNLFFNKTPDSGFSRELCSLGSYQNGVDLKIGCLPFFDKINSTLANINFKHGSEAPDLLSRIIRIGSLCSKSIAQEIELIDKYLAVDDKITGSLTALSYMFPTDDLTKLDVYTNSARGVMQLLEDNQKYSELREISNNLNSCVTEAQQALLPVYQNLYLMAQRSFNVLAEKYDIKSTCEKFVEGVGGLVSLLIALHGNDYNSSYETLISNVQKKSSCLTQVSKGVHQYAKKQDV